MNTSEQWFKVQTKDTGIVLFRGTDYNTVVGKALAAHHNGWKVEVKPDNDWGSAVDRSEFVGVGANPATIGATYVLGGVAVIGSFSGTFDGVAL